VPDTDLLPDQPPLAVQPVAFEAFQLRVAVAPFAIVADETTNERVGAEGVGVTAVEIFKYLEATQPSAPVAKSTFHQVSPLSLAGPLFTVPLDPVFWLPNFAPPAVERTFTVEIVSTLLSIAICEDGVVVAVGVTGCVTATLTLLVTEPPAPVQARV
jgi:hypothetical protein